MWNAIKPEKLGVVIYNFDGKVKHGLMLNIGDLVQVQEECLGWYRGCTLKNGSCVGIFPASHVVLRTSRQACDGSNVLTLVEDVTVSEVGYVLREWNTIRKKMFMEVNNKKNAKFAVMGEIMLELINSRRILISQTLTIEQKKELKSKISRNIDWGNKLIGLDLVARVNDEPVDGFNMTPLQLYQLHLKSTNISKNISSRTIKSFNKIKTPPRFYSVSGCNISHQAIVTFNILMNLPRNVSGVDQETFIHLRLFDAETFKPFTESFVVLINKQGNISRPDDQSNCSVLFEGLDKNDKERDAYLVVHAYRFKEGDASRPSVPSHRKPFGCGAVRITAAFSDKVCSDEYSNFNCKIFNCSEQEFPDFCENLMKRDFTSSHPVKSVGRNFSIFVSLRLFFGRPDEIIEKDGHLLKGVAQSNKMGFSDIIKPDFVRNDLYVTMVSCDIEKSNKTSQRRVEARVVVVDKNGEELKNCFHVGSGMHAMSEYRSYVLYHNNFPKWNETFRLSLPVEHFFNCHLRVEIRHCSHKHKLEKKFLGFSMLNLFTIEGTTLSDGLHNLFIYKCDESKLASSGMNYLELPDKIRPNKPVHPYFQAGDKETITVETLLCSTKLTQNVSIVRLLQWKLKPNNLEGVLENFMKVDGNEIVKFLPDILDSIFEIIGNSPSIQQYVAFKSLCHIFNILDDCKFENFKSVFEMYLNCNFSGSLVFKSLMLSLCKVVEQVLSISSSSNQRDFSSRPSRISPVSPLFNSNQRKELSSDPFFLSLSCFKVLDQLSKCIVRSWQLYLRTYNGSNENLYKDLSVFLHLLCNMSSQSSEDIINIQSTFLINFPCMMLNFSQLLTFDDLASMLNLVINSLPPLSTTHNKINKCKLKCLYILSSSSLFSSLEWRSRVINLYGIQLRSHLESKQNIKLCTKILTNILLVFHEDKNKDLPVWRGEVQTLLNDLMLPLMDMVDGQLNDDMGGLVSCFVSVLTFLDDRSYNSFVEHLQSTVVVKEVLVKIFLVINNLINSDVFPKDWFVARTNANRAFLHTLQLNATTLCEKFLCSTSFDPQLWEYYLHVCVTFAVQPPLQLETFSIAKLQKIKAVYGDMRVAMSHQLLTMWNKLGDNKIHFIPRMIGPFLEVSLVEEEELRRNILPIFFNMMECQQCFVGNFQMVEDELINKLDSYLNEHKGDQAYKILFETTIMDKLKSVTGWQEGGMSFVESVGQLLERLLDYRSMLESEDNMEIKMICTVNLLNFYKDEINRREMYIRYIYKLYELHLASSNHIEAAFSLLLHAQLLTWSDNLLPSSRFFPSQFQWNRKEDLYFNIINEFNEGKVRLNLLVYQINYLRVNDTCNSYKCWEYGVPLCEELAVVYKERIEYAKLSHILQTQSEFYQKILTNHRLQPSYFRVGFYGNGFPLFLRNKEFVYRGNECEKLSSFQNRMTSLFPDATHLHGNVTPSDELKSDNVMYIQINSVRPVAEISSKFLSSQVCESVRSFYKFNDVDLFILDRPYHKGESNPDNEFMTLHIERSMLRTSAKLPGILRWFQIESVDKFHLRPVEVAMDSMQKMNFELQALVIEYSTTNDFDKNLSPLTMRLQGVIDAAVQGGIKKYQQAFFSDEFASKQPQHTNHVSQLQELLECQVQILEYALTIHGKLAPPGVLPLHQRLQELFVNMKTDILKQPSTTQSVSVSTGSSSSSLSGFSIATSNRNSGSFNEPEQSIFKQQKSQTTSKWYTVPDEFSSSTNSMTLKASTILSFISNKKNTSTPTLPRSEPFKRLTIQEELLCNDRPASETGLSPNKVTRSSPGQFIKRNETRTSNFSVHLETSPQPSETTTPSSSTSSSAAKPPNATPPPPILPPKRISTYLSSPYPKPPVALPKPPVALPKYPVAQQRIYSQKDQ